MKIALAHSYLPWLLGFLLLLALLCLLWGFVVEIRLVRKRSLRLPLRQLPPTALPCRIALLADLHWGPGLRGRTLTRILERTLAEKPDLILFAGDLTQRSGNLPQAAERAAALPLFQAAAACSLGAYAVYGNHDRKHAANRLFMDEFLAEAGWTILCNETIELANGLRLGGLDDHFYGQPTTDFLLESTPELLLFHQPDPAAALPEWSRDHIIFSGHSHNGQVTAFGHPIVREREAKRYPHGLYRLSPRRRLLVSGGLGTVHLHARFMNPPEIWIIELTKAD